MKRLLQSLLLGLSLLKKEEEGFTLVELIVVVVIIGILSSIAIPSFQNASLKARQREASILVSSYIKAAQAYKLETGLDAKKAGDLKDYISVVKCPAVVNEIKVCKNMPSDTVRDNDRSWLSTSGYYKFYMGYMSGQAAGNRVYISGAPYGSYSFINNGLLVDGCLNGLTGAVVLTLYDSPGKGHFSNSC